MSTVLLGIADPHWTEKRPSRRKDVDWIGTQSRKINDLFRLATHITLEDAKGASSIIIAGDCFHQPKGELISRRVDYWLSKLLGSSSVPIDTIPGNHDMKGYRLDALENHPYGCLVASGLINQLIWPNYAIRGDNPPVLVTGKEFVPEGPTGWLRFLAESQALYQLKKSESDRLGKKVYCLAMVHGWVGPVETTSHGEPVTSYSSVRGTGIDCLLYGHPHCLDGVNYTTDDSGQIPIVGPGAFIRGTIAEHDVNRKPMIAVFLFRSNGTRDVRLVAVPHEPSDKIFDHKAVLEEKETEEREMKFIQECRQIQTEIISLDSLLESASANGTNPRVVTLTREFLTRAKAREI